MKKISLIITMMLCVLVGFSGCNHDKDKVSEGTDTITESPNVQVTETPIPTETSVTEASATTSQELVTETSVAEATESTDMVVDTKFYSLTLPKLWEKNSFYDLIPGQNGDFSLSFYENVSNAEFGGGWLFSIELYTDQQDYTVFPAYEVLGSITVNEMTYNIIVLYPTDVQFSEERANVYNQMFNDIPEILKTMSYKDGIVFSNEPIPYKSELQQ